MIDVGPVSRKLGDGVAHHPEEQVDLVAIMRQFEMLQKAMSIGNDLNKRAMEEVARVQS